MNKDVKIAVITGASGGIGEAVGKMLQERGFTIIDLSRTKSGVFEHHYTCDVSDKDMVDEVFKKIGEKFGHIDLLINNAGFGQSGALELLSEPQIRKIFEVNTLGLMFITNAALPLMKEGSRIVNNNSMTALLPLPWRAIYCASKSASHMLTLGYRMELKHSKINVTSICLGDVKTGFTKNRQKNYETNERYGDRMKNSTEMLDAREDKRMGVNFVARKIVRQCLRRRKCKPLIIIGHKYKWFYFLHRTLPLSWWLGIMNRLFNKK